MIGPFDRKLLSQVASQLREAATAQDLADGDMAPGGWFEHLARDCLETAWKVGRNRASAMTRSFKIPAWIGTSLQITGAAMVASNLVSPYWGYAVMLPGALAWLVISSLRRDAPQACLQIAFVALNLLGLARWAA